MWKAKSFCWTNMCGPLASTSLTHKLWGFWFWLEVTCMRIDDENKLCFSFIMVTSNVHFSSIWHNLRPSTFYFVIELIFTKSYSSSAIVANLFYFSRLLFLAWSPDCCLLCHAQVLHWKRAEYCWVHSLEQYLLANLGAQQFQQIWAEKFWTVLRVERH